MVKLHYDPEGSGYALCGERGRYIGERQAWRPAATTGDPEWVDCLKSPCKDAADRDKENNSG